MKWFHRVRLNRLADKLEGRGAYKKVGPVPVKKFDMMNLFSEFRWRGKEINKNEFDPEQCKTAACALGWASVDPWFMERDIDGYRNASADRSTFFGLTDAQFGHLFYADHYRGLGGRRVKPSAVAGRLRKAAREG